MAAVATLWACPASALTITTNGAWGSGGGLTVSDLQSSTTYYVEFFSTLPAPVADAPHIWRDSYDDFLADGHWIGGNDHLHIDTLTWYNIPGGYIASFTTQGPDYTVYNPDGSYRHIYFPVEQFALYPYAPDYPIGTPWRATFTDVEPAAWAAVPEPAAWALMLAGFGLTGATLRSGRRRVAT